jgi:hypothetical protein
VPPVLYPRAFNPYLYGEAAAGLISLEEYNRLNDPYVFFGMYVDADRTGNLAQLVPAWYVHDWTTGAQGRGAVILVNNDDDDATAALDCADNAVNSARDCDDLAPLFFYLLYGHVPPGWGASLQVDLPQKIRIFDSLEDGGREIIGPSTGDTHAFTKAQLGRCTDDEGLRFGMEGVAYAAGGFDGLITLTFTVTPGAGAPVSERTQVRVAPWIMMHHGMRATHVYVANLGSNQRFRNDLNGFVGASACVLEQKAPATTCKLMSAEDLIDLGKAYRDRDADSDYDEDGVVRLLRHNNNAANLLRPACIVSPRQFSYDETVMTMAELADRCSLTMDGQRLTERELLDYDGGNGVTNEASLTAGVDPQKGLVNIPGFFYIARTDPTELGVDYLWRLADRFRPRAWLMDLFAQADGNGVTNAERLLVPGQAIDLPASYDKWMQDCMEIGFSSIPGHKIHAVLRAKRVGELRTMPQSLLGHETGFHAPVATRSGKTFDSHGNLEVTPPFELADGTWYPWGRIYFGPGRQFEEFDPDVKDFLEKQIVQQPIELQTNWLSVGHVDEMLTFVPDPSQARADFPYKLVIASPRRAYKLLNDNEWGRPQGGVFRRLLRPLRYRGVLIARAHILELLRDGIPNLASAAELRAANGRAQAHLDAARDTLKAEMELLDTDIIEAPMLFYENDEGQFDALTTGTVNMLVINDHCIIPMPFGPIVGGVDLFQDDLNQKLTALGLTTHWIDDWDEYHVKHGEVHCGTNTKREPADEDLAWWTFE